MDANHSTSSWPEIEDSYMDEFGPVHPDVYKIARELWPSARPLILRTVNDFDTAQTLMMNAVATVSRRYQEEPERLTNLRGYLFVTFSRLLYKASTKQARHEQLADEALALPLIGTSDVEEFILLRELLERSDDWTRRVFEYLTLGYTLTEVAAILETKPNALRQKWKRKLNRARLKPSTPVSSASNTDEIVVISSGLQVVNAELMKWLRQHPEDLLSVHPGTFELIVAEIFSDQGFEVEVLSSWNQPDGGIDLIAMKRDTLAGEVRVGIQCKRYVKTKTVRADLVWALEGRLEKFHLHKGVLATTAKFEEGVLRDIQAHLWRIELRDLQRLKRDLEGWGQFERSASGLWLPK
jgi:restriction endonuclease Mrr